MIRFVVVLAIAIAAAIAAREAFTGTGPFQIYSGVLALLLLLILIGTALRWRGGINAAAVNCPNCNAPQPFLRKPAGFNQMLWGGYTCASCGTQMDKWGRKVDA